MGQWRRNLNARQRKNSRKPKFIAVEPTAEQVIKKIPVTETK